LTDIRDIAEYALDSLKKAGADKAACFTAKGRKDEFNVEASKLSLLRTLFDDELLLTVIKEGKQGEVSVNKLDKHSIDQAVADCMALAASATPDEAFDIAEKIENQSFDQRIGGADKDALFNRTKEFLEQVREAYPLIIFDSMATDFNSRQTVYLNSNGVAFDQQSEYYQFSSSFSAKEGEQSASVNYYWAGFNALDKPFIETGIHRSLLAESVKSINPRMVEGKFVGKIIVTPACYDMIWYTLINCFLDDHAMIEGTSRWKDALHTKVADAKLTFGLSPYHHSVVEAERFTADGYASRNTDFIRDGELTSFALSLYGANKTGKPRAGSTSFGNIEVGAGQTPLAEMIKGIDRGILVNRFSGGMPGPSGDVSGVAKNSFLIENGQITDAIKETMISFNIVELLQNIPAISSERHTNGFSILPWCCFDGVTISGR